MKGLYFYMKLIDIINIKIKSGTGGDGCVSFRREKFVPRGGPDGGHGGKGGSVIIVADRSKYTLLDFRYKSLYKAKNGEHGRGKDQNGKSGDDLVIKVPVGTIVKDIKSDLIIADLKKNFDNVVVAHGGKGGKGNMAFATATVRAPKEAESGEDGEEKEILLELKVIADIGIIGLPNSGKSTFISKISDATPKIADYPFTTLAPNLGVVKTRNEKSLVFADMPGLIEGAYRGVGLGIQFLKHIERTKILLHFIDSSIDESMLNRYKTIVNELTKYSSTLTKKKNIIVATKIDSADRIQLIKFENYVKNSLNKRMYKISSFTNEGIDELVEVLGALFEKEN